MAKKAYANVDEWIFAQGLENTDTTWIREAWRQATRTARVQEMILLGEMRKLRESLQEMEKTYEGVWAVLAGEDE